MVVVLLDSGDHSFSLPLEHYAMMSIYCGPSFTTSRLRGSFNLQRRQEVFTATIQLPPEIDVSGCMKKLNQRK